MAALKGSKTAKNLADAFAGGKVVKIQREGYEEPVAIPKVGKTAIEGGSGVLGPRRLGAYLFFLFLIHPT